MGVPLAVYIHIPFCSKKCSYCSFYSACGTDYSTRKKFTGYLCREIEDFFAKNNDYSIKTIFIGGGTPNSLEPELLARIFNTLKSCAGTALPEECTIEANPEFISGNFLELADSAGITRLSMGIQSLQPETLKLLGRNADYTATVKALELVSTEWEQDKSFDLIYAAPGQDTGQLEDDIKRLLAFDPDHLSLYTLSIEKGTELYAACGRGEMQVPDDDYTADMYEHAVNLLSAAGFCHYEISNFCMPGKKCLHNMVYWEFGPYAGFGPSAAGTYRINGQLYRVTRPADIAAYLDGSILCEPLSDSDVLKDQLLMNLRLDTGICISQLDRRFGVKPQDLFPQALQKWTAAGLLEQSADTLRLNEKGRMLLDSFLSELFIEFKEGEIHLQQFP